MNTAEINRISKKLEAIPDNLCDEILNFIEYLNYKTVGSDLELSDIQKATLDQRREAYQNLPTYSIEQIKNLRS
jgi:hypothetical protein